MNFYGVLLVALLLQISLYIGFALIQRRYKTKYTDWQHGLAHWVGAAYYIKHHSIFMGNGTWVDGDICITCGHVQNIRATCTEGENVHKVMFINDNGDLQSLDTIKPWK